MSSKIAQIKLQKAKIDSFRPFDNTQLQNLKKRFHIGFIHHSNAIEGNTLTLSEVKVLIEDGITIGGKTVAELRETTNHDELMKTIDDMFTITNGFCDIKYIYGLHKILMSGLLPNDEIGKFRTKQVYISGSEDKLPPPNQIDKLMSKFELDYKNIQTLSDIAKLHRDFVKIHPFVDGNGRIARILMNLGLIYIGYLPIIIPVICRLDYIRSFAENDYHKREELFLEQVYQNNRDYIRFFGDK